MVAVIFATDVLLLYAKEFTPNPNGFKSISIPQRHEELRYALMYTFLCSSPRGPSSKLTFATVQLYDFTTLQLYT